jgi:hypothetical protein
MRLFLSLLISFLSFWAYATHFETTRINYSYIGNTSGLTCKPSYGIHLILDSSLNKNGFYKLFLQKGEDNNTIMDTCSTEFDTRHLRHSSCSGIQIEEKTIPLFEFYTNPSAYEIVVEMINHDVSSYYRPNGMRQTILSGELGLALMHNILTLNPQMGFIYCKFAKTKS